MSLFILILLSGSAVDYTFKKYPFFKDIVNLIDSDKLYSKADINRASFEELVDVPYIGEYTASNIINYRQQNGSFSNIEQIKHVKGIRDKNYERFRMYIKVSKQK